MCHLCTNTLTLKYFKWVPGDDVHSPLSTLICLFETLASGLPIGDLIEKYTCEIRLYFICFAGLSFIPLVVPV